MLRNLLVQDWDLDDDGEPETLRLLFATSRRWLEDGKQIVVERSPRRLDRCRSGPSRDSAMVAWPINADLPTRNPAKRTLLRARVPDGWRVTAARIGG